MNEQLTNKWVYIVIIKCYENNMDGASYQLELEN